MWSDILSALKAKDFERLKEIMTGIDAITLFTNPWVIGVMVIICIFFIFRGMEKVLVTFLSIPAVMILFQKTVQGTDALEFSGQKLLIFVGGFTAVAVVNIYFYFVR